ncbi:D-sedoheptulose 7-phosphate isomerase [Stella humosa]|uniref:Phosphoheptose isomerase n=1 Tax=Stella humosa TaxID=94 RepID=A0A3N1LP91_9PROT|nr:SIS domain-containing protein [Stella humosa]ROP91035.1 D-sedoheptulose 7-phosphate isomerase [Stella humosa]BBK34615.1 phosphoheptose isomerase [Stella humosa]
MAAFDAESYVTAEFAEHAAVQQATPVAVRAGLLRLVEICATAVEAGGKILFFGNGGSAGDAQHLATELAVRYQRDRAPIAAIALTTDSSALTAIGNDLGFEQLFARQVQAIGRAGDVAIGITTSGRSANVARGLEAARAIGMHAAAFSGGTGGTLAGLADPLILVPSTTTARIQEMHITIGQILCGALERRLGLV